MSKWNIKKILAGCLLAAMTCQVVGCGENKTNKDTSQTESEMKKSEVQSTSTQESGEVKEPVTLVWYYSGNGLQKDTEMVQTEFNKKLQEYEGMEHVSVVLNTYEYSDYAQAVSLARSAGEQMDIVQTYQLEFSQEVADENFIALDELLEEYPNLKNEFQDWVWGLGSANGSIYIVPCLQRVDNMFYFQTPKYYVDTYGDADEFRKVFGSYDSTIDDIAALLEEWIVKVQEGEGKSKYLSPLAYYYTATVNSGRGLAAPFDVLSGSFTLNADSETVGNLYTGETAVRAYEITAEWYEKGYVYADMASVNLYDYVYANMMNEEAFIYHIGNGGGSEELVSTQLATKYGFDCYAFPIANPLYVANKWAAGGNGISSTCEHPEEAMRFLELMNTAEGEELYNMLIYGLEDVHYTKIDDTHIKTLDYDGEEGSAGVPFAGKKWLLGNTTYAWINQGAAMRLNS